MTSCGSSNQRLPDRIQVESTPSDITINHPPLPPSVNPPTGINIDVLTPETTSELNQRVESGKIPPYVFFGMSEDGWINLSKWHQDLLRFIRQQREIIEYYRNIEDTINAGGEENNGRKSTR